MYIFLGRKKKTLPPLDGDIFIFKGESGEYKAAELTTTTTKTTVHEDGFHRCDYLLPDGTRCVFR